MRLLIYHKEMPTGGSDRTLKKDIKPIKGGLKSILQLRPVSWRWKSNDEVKHGFIAQEVDEVIPHLVSDGIWEDGTTRKHLSTDGIMPYLVAAIHEQQKQIDDLNEKLAKK